MAKLSGMLGRAIARMVRIYLETANDLAATRALLMRAAHNGTCPVYWERDLAEIKKTPQYRSDAERFEPILARIDQDADESDLIELLQQMTQGKQPN
jgi:hypothetical protein